MRASRARFSGEEMAASTMGRPSVVRPMVSSWTRSLAAASRSK
jgi:hypothetical protein